MLALHQQWSLAVQERYLLRRGAVIVLVLLC